MLYVFKIDVPANTTQASPYVVTKQLIAGEIVRVVFQIPAGHQGLAHLQVLDRETQIYPVNNQGDIAGDDIEVSFTDKYQLDNPAKVKFVAWNTDTLHQHSFFVWINLAPSSLVEKKKALMKKDVERAQEIMLARERRDSFLDKLVDLFVGDV